MKLWGWWRKQDDTATSKDEKPQLLEDLPPKFDDNPEAQQKIAAQLGTSFGKELGKISVDDFKHINSMPCFRQAMLTGIGLGVVSGGVMGIAGRPMGRVMNWVFGGFLVGSVVTWEQCRYKIRQGKRNMRHAQAVYRDRMLQEKEEEEAKTKTK